jgi:hypothetical protein
VEEGRPYTVPAFKNDALAQRHSDIGRRPRAPSAVGNRRTFFCSSCSLFQERITDGKFYPHVANCGPDWACHNVPLFPKFEPRNHVIGDTLGRPLLDGLAHTQACPSSASELPFFPVAS